MQKIRAEEIGDTLVVLLQEDIDAADQRLALLWQNPAPKRRECHLWIDCANLKCVRQVGFGHFISQLLLLRKEVEKITLLNLSEKQLDLLHLLQLSSFFSVLPDVEKARQLVQAS